MANFLFDLGMKSGLPRYVSLIALLQAGVLVIPEAVWATLGINAPGLVGKVPAFLRYYVQNSPFPNAMLVFWITSPIACAANTILCVRHYNGHGFAAYKMRRVARLAKLGKTADHAFVAGLVFFVAAYLWGTFWHLQEPRTWGDFVPVYNRFVMIVIHAGAIGYVLPLLLAALLAELRAMVASQTDSRK